MNSDLQLISYIAPGAPATRRPADGDEWFVRPEIGFTPAWYRQHLAINFGEPFHTDPAYRRDCVVRMRAELRQRFPGTRIGGIDRPDATLDLLTGTYGACSIAAIYGVPIVYADNNWPNCAPRHLTDEQMARLECDLARRNGTLRRAAATATQTTRAPARHASHDANSLNISRANCTAGAGRSRITTIGSSSMKPGSTCWAAACTCATRILLRCSNDSWRRNPTTWTFRTPSIWATNWPKPPPH